MNPQPYLTARLGDDSLQARLALPFHNPLVKPFMKIGINAYKPMYPKPIELQPMPPALMK